MTNLLIFYFLKKYFSKNCWLEIIFKHLIYFLLNSFPVPIALTKWRPPFVMCRVVGDCRSADDILAKKKAKHILQHKKQL